MKAILFDFDGTLVSLRVDWERVRRQLRRLFALHGFYSAFHPLAGALQEGRAFCEGTHRRTLWSEALSILRREELAGLGHAVVKPGVPALLAAITSREVAFGIVSNNHSAVITGAFRRFGLPQPNVVVGRDAVRQVKPHPEGALAALAKLQLLPRDCWYVGHSAYDVAVGNTVGMRTYVVDPSGSTHHAAMILRSIGELETLLEVKDD